MEKKQETYIDILRRSPPPPYGTEAFEEWCRKECPSYNSVDEIDIDDIIAHDHDVTVYATNEEFWDAMNLPKGAQL